MTETTSFPDPPVAPTKPHTWERPTGAVDDPWAWLRNREDPDTIAYLEAENTYADAYFGRHADQIEELFAEIKSRVQETDESVPVRHGPWWYVTRTIEGESYPVFCRGRSIDEASDVILDCNAEAAGHEYFDVHAVDSSPDHSLLAWSSDTDGGERYTLRVRDLASCDRPPRRADRHVVVGRCGLVRRWAVAALCPLRRGDAAVPDLAPPARHTGRRRRAGHRGARQPVLPRGVAESQ